MGTHPRKKTKLILSTSNVAGVTSPHLRRLGTDKSNVELVNSLSSQFSANKNAENVATDGEHFKWCDSLGGTSYEHWTSREGDYLYVPSIDFAQSGLTEERSQYEITAKLFFLPGSSSGERRVHAQEAVDLVLKELHVSSIDLLIVSFPGISFDPNSHCDDPNTRGTGNTGEGEDYDSIARTWSAIESLHEKGLASRIGVAEFGSDRLAHFLPKVNISPAVDQIFIKEYCAVPAPLMQYTKQHNIEVLTHEDCTNILPGGTTRELLGSGEKGAGLLLDQDESGEGLKGDIFPQWVIKYTAIVHDRGVVENKGYFAMAELHPQPA
ncbi:uncharacterized protein KY384_008178 [Bacidia gigantensis]|uniref:uncharacterized protein n=1 Tax=Bacidia gigantensis TaxID=2732470 RepID=UPI001D0515CF|nr:uncharacterized protein KY384_008178 [Bacidia gigantensis]KAG8526749.1 hypothetical protein KY384_008178 [Bacidia gigantensis]